ncbi:MAG: hypothetical protein AB1414_10040 [bacterium]
MYIMFIKAGATTYDVIWDIVTICIVIYAIISILYLWRNRRCFS